MGQMGPGTDGTLSFAFLLRVSEKKTYEFSDVCTGWYSSFDLISKYPSYGVFPERLFRGSQSTR